MTVLYVDDDADDTEIFCSVLADLNPAHMCLTMNDGYQTLDLLQKMTTLPDVVIIDNKMQRMDGVECLEKIRSIDALAGIPVIIASSIASQETIRKVQSLNAFYMEKGAGFESYTSHLREAFVALGF